MKVVIIGGVAAGAGVAARLRRLDETAEIVLMERGANISFANCGLPYHIGNVIEDREDLLVMPEQKFRKWFNVDVRTGHTVTAIHRASKTLSVTTSTGEDITLAYDKLVIATGASPLELSLPGIDDPRILRLWTLPDMDAINARITAGAKRAVVVGGGFVGLEVAENLRERGLEVALVQHSAHLLPTFDCEMASLLHREVTRLGIELLLATDVVGFESSEATCLVALGNGENLAADLVVLSVGVKPNSELARDAGLELGKRGHIRVDTTLRTNDPDIYAAGDVIEVLDPITQTPTAIPLAGPANKQGRIVATNLAGGHATYPGTYGASVIKIGKLTAATVGLNEAQLKSKNIAYHRIYTHPASHASYYPEAKQLHLKLLFGPDGKIYGAQAIGEDGVDKRIDTIACAMACGRTAPELATLEFAYAPPYSSAKDPVNYLGMIAEDILAGITTPAYADAIPTDAFILDVREPGETARGTIPSAVNIPLTQLRSHLNELPKDRTIIVCCQVGLRGYIAERILKQNGFTAANLSGGYVTWRMFHTADPLHPCSCLGAKA